MNNKNMFGKYDEQSRTLLTCLLTGMNIKTNTNMFGSCDEQT